MNHQHFRQTLLRVTAFLSISFVFGCNAESPTESASVAMPVIAGLIPNSGFLGRSTQVQIATVGTAFQSAMPSVDFADPGITVSKMAVNSDGNITLSVDISDAANVGAHDVSITSGDRTIKLSGAFSVLPSLTAEQQATPASGMQGGLVPIVLRNQDYVQNPFITTFGQPRLGGAAASPITTGATITAGRMTATALIDPLAAAGPLASVRVAGSDVFGQPVTYYAAPQDANMPTVTARNPTALTLGTPIGNQDFLTPLSTNLYRFATTAASQILYVQYSNFGQQLPSMNAALAPKNGMFGSGQPLNAQGTFINNMGQTVMASLALLPNAETYYLSTYPTNFTGAATGYTHDLVIRALPSSTFSAKEPSTADTGSTPLATVSNIATGSGAYATDGATDYAGDVDYIRFGAATANSDIMVQVQAPTATAISMMLTSDADCLATTVSGSGVLVSTAHDIATTTDPRCLRILTFGNKYPIPYKVLIATP
jgi:hypothetical protein